MSTDPRLGSELAGYRLEALLGRGGMGVVYRAHDLALDRNVALKILSPELAEDVRFRERFLTESRLAASIDHPNIVPVYDAGEVAGELYIAMRYVDGSDLKKLLAEGLVPKERAVTIVSQVAAALDAAHERGLVHRDVKPSNVLLDERGHAYLADFGLSRRLGEPGAALGAAQSLGTIDYVAPEQIRGEQVDGRADLYSLGCLLYECVTGKPPFARSTDSAVLFAHLEEEPPAAPGLEDVMRTALAKEPDDRFQTGHDLVEAARKALGIAEPKRSRWPLAVAAAGVALIAAALLGFFLTRGDGGGVAAVPGADSLVRIDPKTNQVARRSPVGRSASGVAVGGGYVWVSNLADGTISRVDPKTGRALTIVAHVQPTGVAVAGGSAVAAGGADHKVTAFDAKTGTLLYPATLRPPSNGTLQIAGGPSGVWFADGAGGIAARVDNALTVGSPSEEISIPPDRKGFLSAYFSFAGLAVGDGQIWVAGDARGRTVWRLDPATGRAVATTPLPFVPGAIATGAGGVWVTSLLDDTVSRIDPATNRVVATVRAGRGVRGVAVGEGAVWTANSFDGTVSRIDPRTNDVVATVPVAGTPLHVAAGSGGIWVTTAKPAAPRPKGTIEIGVLSDCEGNFASAYNDSIAPAELPLIQRGGVRAGAITDGVRGVAIGGRPVHLVFGCADGTTGGALTEARRLVEQAGVDVLVGPLAGDEGLALQEYARRNPTIAFVNGSSSSQQLHPARNFFSFWYDGAQWMAGVGAYAYHELGWRTAATVTNTDEFDWAQTAAFVAEFCSLGGKIEKRIWLPQGAQDFSGIVDQVPPKVDGVLVEAQGAGPLLTLARGVSRLKGGLGRKVVSGTTVVPASKLGVRVRGIVWGGPTPHPPPSYLAALREAFPEIAKDFLGFAYDYAYYDAMDATLQALDRVHGDLSHGERRFMDALARVTLDAPNGRTTLDANHRAIAPNALFETLTPTKSRVIRTIPNVDASFGGYFTAKDPPPSKRTPACVKRTPPRWAR